MDDIVNDLIDKAHEHKGNDQLVGELLRRAAKEIESLRKQVELLWAQL